MLGLKLIHVSKRGYDNVEGIPMKVHAHDGYLHLRAAKLMQLKLSLFDFIYRWVSARKT